MENTINTELHDNRYDAMEFAWVSSGARRYPYGLNDESYKWEQGLFKEWFYGECGQKYINNTKIE